MFYPSVERSMHGTFVRYARRLLLERGATITFVDVGSRNGVTDLASVAEFVEALGFEPNPTEYEKLVTGRTDAQSVGERVPSYRSLSYAPFALAERAGRRPLYITRGPGAVGMLEPNFERLREIRWKGGEYVPNFAEQVFTVERVIDVEVRTLQDFARERGIDHLDYLKVDVEGCEYEVLVGAGDLLGRTGVLKVEVCFIEFRKGQKLFSEVDRLLRPYGFDLLRYEVLPEQVGFKERTAPWTFGPSIGVPERYGQPLSGDAIYVNRAIHDSDRALAQAVVLLDKNYLDEALFVLRTRAGVDDPELFHLLRSFRGTWRHRLADWLVRAALQLNVLRSPRRAYRWWKGWRELERRGVRRPGAVSASPSPAQTPGSPESSASGHPSSPRP